MTDQSSGMTINPALAKRVQQETGQNVYLCYECVKCSSGCPVGEFFDWQPNQIMRSIQLGQEDIALYAETPWLCASCQTCSTRCPQGLDIPAIMDFLTRESRERGIKPVVPEVDIFTDAFMREIRLWGRAYELGMMAEVKLRTGNLLDDMDLGLKMFAKRKMALFPTRSKPPRKVKPVPGAVNAVAYYPGCSLHSTAPEFDRSTRAVCKALDINLIEPEGWGCCGSSAAHRADPVEAVRLPMTNLSIIEQSGFTEVTMPCAACFNRHKTAQHEIRHSNETKAVMDKRIGYEMQDTVQVHTLTDTILQHVGTDGIADRVQHPLENLNIAPYYGCLLTRPPEITEAEHPENPTDMDAVIAALGATVVDWSYKTTCCGAAHSLTRPDIVLKLSQDLIDYAHKVGADAIATACPLCHANLDARQFQMNVEKPMPVFYFTQLMALALGLPEKAAALDKNMVDPRPLLAEKEVLASHS